jgi:predicted TIM-barrel fold metal-dependent hydrolase
MNRRKFIALAAGAGLLAGTYALVRPRGGFMHPCLQSPLPEKLARHKIIQQAWEGIDISQFWDCHVHLVGLGHGQSGASVNPDMQSPGHPLQFLQYKFYLNASCTGNAENVDQAYIEQLIRLQDGMDSTYKKLSGKHGRSKLMLLAFDCVHDLAGNRNMSESAFYIPNKYAQTVARLYSNRFEWIASVHPYRKDVAEELEWCIANGARAVKWLPSAMGINPASPRCDKFYDVLYKNNLPLLVHAGGEIAIAGHGRQDFGNPLHLRRPLERGVKVIVAHSASSGQGVDLDQGKDGPRVASFELFARLMDDRNYQKNCFGEISAITQVNRIGTPLETILTNEQWHSRIINGSDHPLPAIPPLFSLKWIKFKNYITAEEADVLAQIRHYNPLLFDFVLKRTVRFRGKRLPDIFFQGKRHFARAL